MVEQTHTPIEYGLIPMERLKELSGLEIFRLMLDGELPSPPIARTLDFMILEVEKGRVTFTGTPKIDHYNPLGTVHGGYIATLLDSAMACAVQSTLRAGQGYTSVEIKVNFDRPLTVKTGPVRAIGEVVSIGRRIGTAEGRLVDEGGKLYAHGSTTCLIFPL
jgi:uncharacterized protein (TIGR00369 family)